MSEIIRNKHGLQLFKRVCSDCGAERWIRKSRITKNTKCWNCTFTKHGMSRSGTYNSWHCMKLRCYSKGGSFSRYGAKGIKVCDRWLKFENFLEDMGERPKGMTIDRIDNDSDYTSENCRWATLFQQQANKRKTIWLTYKDKTYTVSQWAYLCGCPYKRFWRRLKDGWTLEQALFTPLKKGKV